VAASSSTETPVGAASSRPPEPQQTAQQAPPPQQPYTPPPTPPPQQTYTPPPPQPAYAAARPVAVDDTQPVSLLGFLGTIVLFCIPIVGLVFCIIWSIKARNVNRRNLSRAYLILFVIGIVISILTYIFAATAINASFGKFLPKNVLPGIGTGEYEGLIDAVGGLGAGDDGNETGDGMLGGLIGGLLGGSELDALLGGDAAGDGLTDADGDSADSPGTSDGADASGSTGTAGGLGAGTALGSLIDWMKDGTYTYDFKTTTEGDGYTSETTGTMTADGSALAVKSTANGETSRVIIQDDKLVIVMDSQKLAMTMGTGAEAAAMGVLDYSKIEYVGSGTGEVDGRTLPYEEYVVRDDGGGLGDIPVKYYMDGGSVCAIESEAMGYKTVTTITNASNSVNRELFEIPADYTQY
jgi:hypothetical protein